MVGMAILREMRFINAEVNWEELWRQQRFWCISPMLADAANFACG